jgi:signal transduction histidine kinase
LAAPAPARQTPRMAAAASVPRRAPVPARRGRRLAAEAAYLASGAVMGVVGCAAFVAGGFAALCFGVVILGFPVVFATFVGFRRLADLERRRAALVLGKPLEALYHPTEGRMADRLRTVLHDPQSWRDVLYLALIGPVGIAKAALALAVWAAALAALTAPAWWWAVEPIDSWTATVAVTAIGVALLPAAAAAQRWLARGEAAMARALLAPSLAERVERLTASRAGAVSAAAAELQRIERDLHDGAQARLVALALDLGMAEERFDRDPDGARQLVGEARQEARRALAELRDLARGMRPSLLAERGLGPAIAALAARGPIPAEATVDVPRRPAEAVESAAWFVVSEALANAGKHSGAARATVHITQQDGRLHIEVSDDGSGGADPDGAGLRGLRQRVGALDGTLEIDSPVGGPTVVRAVMPCGW